MHHPLSSRPTDCGAVLAVLTVAAFALTAGIGAVLLCAEWLQRNQPALAWPA